MSLAAALVIQDKPASLFEKPAMIQTQDSLHSDSTETSRNFPLNSILRPQNALSEEVEEIRSQDQEEDSQSFSDEPTKRVKTGEQGYNMLKKTQAFSNKRVLNKEESGSPPHKILSPSTQAENPGSIDRRSGREFNESLSGYNSSTSSDLVAGKDCIEEEDSENEFDFPIIDLEDLVVEDEVIADFRKAKEQVEQLAKLKSYHEQSEPSVSHNRQFMDLNQRAFLQSQAFRFNQLQQLNQLNFIHQSLNLPVNPAALASFQQMKVASYYNMLNQYKAQAGWQNYPTILGKRRADYEHSGNMGFFHSPRSEEAAGINVRRSREEQIVKERINKNSKNIFVIERTTPKKPTKKPIFTIIKQKPRTAKPKVNRPKKLGLIDSLMNSQRSLLAENKPLENSMNFEVSKIGKSNMEEEKEENLKRAEESKLEKKEAVEVSKTLKKKEVKKADDLYVIKLHVETDEDYEEVNETPVGDEFQIEVGAFKKEKMKTKKRSLKLVWDPSKTDEKTINKLYQKVESKFDKKIINQEFALKAFQQNKMNAKKVMEELETNKMYLRNFFEIRQKVLRNRVLHNNDF